jgi:hypothetical protein
VRCPRQPSGQIAVVHDYLALADHERELPSLHIGQVCHQRS